MSQVKDSDEIERVKRRREDKWEVQGEMGLRNGIEDIGRYMLHEKADSGIGQGRL